MGYGSELLVRSGMRLASWLAVIGLTLTVFAAAATSGSGATSSRASSPSLPAATPAPVPAEPPPTPVAVEPPATEPDGPPVPPAAERLIEKIPILMYHEIGDKPNNNYVGSQNFEAQMKWLAENGYHGVTLGEVYRHLHQGAAIPAKPVALTFDDGYATFYTTVVPILSLYHFSATSFVITADVGHPEFMTWDQVTALPKLGMEVGSHTLRHLDLRFLKPDQLQAEIIGSKVELEARLSIPVQFFCYPSGQYNQAAYEMVKKAGYFAAVTTANGPARPDDDPLIWDRVRISRSDTLAAFGTKVKQASAAP